MTKESFPIEIKPLRHTPRFRPFFFGYLSFWVSKKKVTRPRQRTKPERSEAGLEDTPRTRPWIPAFAGMTCKGKIKVGPSFRWMEAK